MIKIKKTPLNSLQIKKDKAWKYIATGFVAFIILKALFAVLIFLTYSLDSDCKRETKFYCPAIYSLEFGLAMAYEAKLKVTDLIFVDTKVLVEDDKGNIRQGLLDNRVASSRNVRSGDKVRLTCRTFTMNKITTTNCEIQFSGFDRQSPYPRDNPSYGVYAPFGVSLDAEGNPKPGEVLRYKSSVLKTYKIP